MATAAKIGMGTLCVNCYRDLFRYTGFQPCLLDRLDLRGYENCCHCGEPIHSNIYARVELDKIGHPEFTQPPRSANGTPSAG